MTTRAGTGGADAEWSIPPIQQKAYVSTAAFNTQIYSYTESVDSNFQRRGLLQVHPKATTTNCPSGRILVVNGKRLVPGVNPMTDFGSTGLGPSPGTFLMGVYDSFSDITGFIDVTTSLFKLADVNRPSSDFLLDVASGQTPANSTSLAGLTVAGGGAASIPFTFQAGPVTLPTTGPPNVATLQTVILTYPGVTPNSIILLSYGRVNGYAGGIGPIIPLYIGPISAGSFRIYGQAGWDVFVMVV
jgi:hypothetical protein